MRAALLRWYDRNKRDLPWRRTRDPYAIWISETMLQQTQVATVLSYYHRFMEAFPSVEALDRASLDAVRSVWSGLGYYRRAEKPETGRPYTGRPSRRPAAGGLRRTAASAGHRPVHGRRGHEHRLRPSLRRAGRQRASRLRPPARPQRSQADRSIRQPRRCCPDPVPATSNQAVMELGATVCLPATPLCERCPVAHWCRARAAGVFHLSRRQPIRAKAVEWPLVLVESRSRILLHRRPEGGLLAGLWELPRPETLPTGVLDETLRRLEPVAVIRHAITDMRITAPVYVLRRRISVKGAAWAMGRLCRPLVLSPFLPQHQGHTRRPLRSPSSPRLDPESCTGMIRSYWRCSR